MAEETKRKFKYECEEQNAHLIDEWLKSRGGLLIWPSVNLCDPDKTMTTPALNLQGVRPGKPRWDMANEPSMHITDAAEVGVITAKEHKRFHVGTRMGGQGLSIKVTDGGTRRIHRELEKAREQFDGAWYEFDYSDEKNCVIMVTDKLISMPEWRAQRDAAKAAEPKEGDS